MAADIKSLPYGGSSKQSELRIVLFGNTRDEKNEVIKSLLNCEDLTGEKVGLCTLYRSKIAGRRISVIEAPEWDRLLKTPEKINEHLDRSVSLCPPGPHAFLLLVPVRSLCEDPSSELDSALQIMKSLPERVWRHTIILFHCDEGVEESALREHIRNASKVLGKCGGRSFVLHKRNPQIHELFQEIDHLVEENHGDVFIPQTYYDLIQKKTKELSDETELRRRSRRESLEQNRPQMSKDKVDSEEKKKTVEASKHTFSEEGAKISMDYKQFVLLMAVIGALLGSVTGAVYGVLGSFTGIVFGSFVGVLLAILSATIYTNFYSRVYPDDSAL